MKHHPRPKRRSLALCALALAALLTACTEAPAPEAAAPKPVKTELLGAASQQQSSTFVGTLRARQRSDLSFESPGRVAAVLVDVGDHVKAGQELAKLDEGPARWRLEQATAQRTAAAAAVAERRTNLRQQKKLAADKIISAAALQTAQAAYQQAASQLQAADAAVATAKRDMGLTRITAPFAGEIAARRIEPFSDVAPGQAVLQMETGDALEVVTMLPDTVVATLSPGARAKAVNGVEKLELTMERLSGRSDNGSLVQTIFNVQDAPASVRSGGVVSVELPLADAPALTLPVSALMASPEAGQGSVFVVEGTVLLRRPVRVDDVPLAGGRIAVLSGVKAGERVVVAGTAYLKEGQEVVVHPAQTMLTGAAR